MTRLQFIAIVVCFLFVLVFSAFCGFAYPVPDVAAKGELIHEGDWIIDGCQVKTIENENWLIKGNLIVKDRAELIVKNSTITFDTHYKNEFWFYIRNNGHVEISDSVLTENYLGKFYGGTIIGELMVNAQDESSLIIENVESPCRFEAHGKATLKIDSSSLGQIYWRQGFDEITNSEVLAIVLIFSRGNLDSELVGLKSNQEIDEIILSGEGKELILKNVSTLCWHISLENDFKNRLVIKDSEINEIWPNFDQTVTIDGLRPGYFDEWAISDNVKGHEGYNLSLINTRVNKWKSINYNDAYLKDVQLQLDPWNHKEVVVEDSHIIFLDARGSKYLKFTNSIVDNSHYIIAVPGRKEETGRFFVEFDNSVNRGDFEIACEYIFFTGDASFEMGLEQVNFQKGILEREFSLDKDETVELELVDPNGETIWKGYARKFKITFDENNYSEKWLLKARRDNRTVEKEIGLLTDTPVVVLEHINLWLTIGIIAAVLFIGSLTYFFIRRRAKA
jgi:hypothetical protein